ncbi:MAG TPA: isoprenylcysteine carboxylmethyltransferase family protein [Draconibacterium sp.]|nr:isoprenylcysteine carboxylmethyltransferase family protein [Draconibacterium sp.]
MKRQGVSVNQGVNNKKESFRNFYYFFILIAFLWLFEIANPVFKIPVLLLPKIITTNIFDLLFLKISGALVLMLALALLTLTLTHFKNSFRVGLSEKNPGKLVTTGIFSISRNPFFLSLDLYFLGIALLLPSVFFISFSVLAVISIHFFILKEEKFMRKVYGAEYEIYRQRVRRYL